MFFIQFQVEKNNRIQQNRNQLREPMLIKLKIQIKQNIMHQNPSIITPALVVLSLKGIDV